ncbi:MAG: C-glycoside deglycosidase beta subunit domain-containing protein [Candidatus Hodarchaeales archaeon]
MPSEDLLRQLFVKKSLKNNESGFQLSLKNPISDATIVDKAKISIKGEDINEKYKDFEIEIAGERFNNKNVSKTKPFKFPVKSNATLFFKRDNPLPAGKYKIKFDFLSEEYGELKFSMKEKIRE